MTIPQQAPTLAQMLSGGGKYFKFEKIGDSVSGIIVTVHDPEPQTDIKDGTPVIDKKTGKIKYQFRIDVQTDIRNDEDDDGLRTLYVRGWMTGAISDALRAAGSKTLDPGARLTVACNALDDPPFAGAREVKKFAASYEPPVQGASAAANALLGEQAAAAPTPAAPAAPPAPAAPQAPAAPAGPPPGIDPTQWAAWSPEQQQQVLAAMPNF
ncbi:hypothetical protein [Tsukamurella sp. 1534]|uniref:hypothetical protein n=1 Tax=Tsukamurella sp. 1534 TaxID=1151061 RepID=UPI0002E68CDC|nr:hypothetical protein [Tsukamurella sp. 1534]